MRNTTTAVHLYRIAQEAVTNAVRHGQPQCIRIELNGHDQRASLSIANDGLDFPTDPPDHGGMGLEVMRHRAEMIGGILEIRRRPSGGTQVVCTFAPRSEVNEGEIGHDHQESRQNGPKLTREPCSSSTITRSSARAWHN